MAHVEELNGAQFDAKVVRGDKPSVVDFYATWCGPCKVLSPIVDELAREFDGKVNVYKVNIDNESDLAAQYGVMAVPTLVAFKGGQEIRRNQGALPKDKLVPIFQELAG